jgi:hypothetical protein
MIFFSAWSNQKATEFYKYSAQKISEKMLSISFQKELSEEVKMYK